MRILYLDLDTLRPDHLGCYGYHRNTSPNIDRLAAQGVRFDNCYCSDAPCLPSRAALMTGRFGIHTGVIDHGGTCADPRLEGRAAASATASPSTCLPASLAAGLHTVSISPFGERHSAWWFYAGFREIYNTGKGGMESAEDVTPTALDWIERNAAKDNWFLHVNYWDPHTPYRAPPDFGNPFARAAARLAHARGARGAPAARRAAQRARAVHVPRRLDPRWPRYPGELRDMDDLRRLIDGYDCGIRYMDDHIGQLFAALAEAGVLDDMAIIVSSDHGENLGELGLMASTAPPTRSPAASR